MSKKLIERVHKDEPHTLVLKQGGATAYLRFNEEITVADLIGYCRERLDWMVEGLPFAVDGQRYAASLAAEVKLQPSTGEVTLGQEARPTVVEMVRDVGSKGCRALSACTAA